MTVSDTFHGVFAIPCATFDAGGDLDPHQLEHQVAFCLSAGAHGIAVPLLASEFYTMSDAERRTMVEVTVGVAARAVPVIANVSGTSTAHAVEFVHHAARAGADGVIAMPPYIARRGAEAVLAYFTAIGEASPLPVMIQNAGPPQPLGFPMETPLVVRLFREVTRVRYLKEERTPGPLVLSEVVSELGDANAGVFGGRAGLYFIDELHRGAAGTMVAPEFIDLLVAVYEHFTAGRQAEATILHRRLLPGLTKEVLLGPSYAKRVLRHRGVLDQVTVRSGSDHWDEIEQDALEELWSDLEPLVVEGKSQSS